jgi:hypothetical protein
VRGGGRGVWGAVNVQVMTTKTIYACCENVNCSCQASTAPNLLLSAVFETTLNIAGEARWVMAGVCGVQSACK